METENCVNCLNPLDTDSSMEITEKEQKPRPGDFTICLYCGQPYWFDGDLKRHPISKKQYNAMPYREKDILKAAWKMREDIIRGTQG